MAFALALVYTSAARASRRFRDGYAGALRLLQPVAFRCSECAWLFCPDAVTHGEAFSDLVSTEKSLPRMIAEGLRSK